jgi:hypothetical protein
VFNTRRHSTLAELESVRAAEAIYLSGKPGE